MLLQSFMVFLLVKRLEIFAVITHSFNMLYNKMKVFLLSTHRSYTTLQETHWIRIREVYYTEPAGHNKHHSGTAAVYKKMSNLLKH